jgi:dihydrofolate synthase/folylpolyglutamate synthase
MAYLVFVRRGVEMVVLETGMGGRLDATNVVVPVLSVITPVDIDHEKFLGSTIREIAFEKAGILKPGRPAVFARQRPEALAVLERRAIETGSPVSHAEDWLAQDLHIDAYGSRFTAVGPGGELPIKCPLIGQHQVDNALTAIAALSALHVAPDAICRGIAATEWPGRLECVRQSPAVFLDGAHNAAGAWALAQFIREFHRGRKVWIVFGAMRDKDLSVIAPLLFPLASELILTAPAQSRAFTAREIRDLTGEARARLTSSVAEALQLAASAQPGDVVFITGSLYLVGEARGALLQ